MSSILDALRKAQNRQRGGERSDAAPEPVADDAPEGSPASGAGREPVESAPRRNPRPGPAILVAVAGLAIGALAARLFVGGASRPLEATVATETPPGEEIAQPEGAPNAPQKLAATATKPRAERARGGAAGERRMPKGGKDAGRVGVDAQRAAAAVPAAIGRESRAETPSAAENNARPGRETGAHGDVAAASARKNSSSVQPPAPAPALADRTHTGAPGADRADAEGSAIVERTEPPGSTASQAATQANSAAGSGPTGTVQAAAATSVPPATPPSPPTAATAAAAQPEESPVLDAPPTDAPVVALLFIRWSREPANRVASLRGSGGKLMLVREGDIVEGMRVSEIRPDALELQWRGTRFLLLAAR